MMIWIRIIAMICPLAACMVSVESNDKKEATEKVEVTIPPDAILECWRHKSFVVCRTREES